MLSGCDVQRLPWCSPAALSTLDLACLGFNWLLGGDSGEPGTEVGVTAHTKKQPLGWKGGAKDWESRDPGPTLSLVHRAAMGSKPPALPGLRLLIHKMGLITHYLPYKVVRKIRCTCSQLIGWLVASWSPVASFACFEVDGGYIYQSALVVSPVAAPAGQLQPLHMVAGVREASSGTWKTSQDISLAVAQCFFHRVLFWARQVTGHIDSRQ